jgi:hypothetical protein
MSWFGLSHPLGGRLAGRMRRAKAEFIIFRETSCEFFKKSVRNIGISALFKLFPHGLQEVWIHRQILNVP